MAATRVAGLVRQWLLAPLVVAALVPARAVAETGAPASEPSSGMASPPAAAASQPAAAAATATPAPARPAGPPATGSTVRWPDADDTAEALAEGSIEACSTIVMPLTLIPGVGEVVGTVVEWACLVPALLAIDYVQAHHGRRDSFLWQPAVALVAQKLFRDLLEVPTIAGIVALALVYGAVAVPALIFYPAFIPVGVAGLISLGGIAYVFMHKFKEHAGDWVFESVYRLLTSEVAPPKTGQLAERAWIKPPLNPFFRAGALLATAGGAKAHHRWSFWIPVVGAVVKSDAQRAAFKEQIRRTGRDLLGESEHDYHGVDTAIDILVGARGWMGAIGQALLFGGAALFFVGTTTAAVDLTANRDMQRYAAVVLATGITGVAAAGGGALLILAREIPEKLWLFTVPLVYGICPPAESTAVVE
ncbi:MAG: hypothetical protein JXR83_23375 [Deltaproteobacteria bacterium]|nr:hypothetical protein [Deltaproteobacteria bacterium]